MPLLTVETEVNGDSKNTNKRGPSLVGLLGLSCRSKKFLFYRGCSSWPSIKFFFLTVHFPYAQQAGHWAQAAVLGLLSVSRFMSSLFPALSTFFVLCVV